MRKPAIEPGTLCCSGLVRAAALRSVGEASTTFEAEDLTTGRLCLLHEISPPGADPSLARHFQLAVRRLRDLAESPFVPLLYTFAEGGSCYLLEAIPEGQSLAAISPPLAADELAGAFRALLAALVAIHEAEPPLFHGALSADRVFPARNRYGVVLSEQAYVLKWLTGGTSDAARTDVLAAARIMRELGGSGSGGQSDRLAVLPMEATAAWILDDPFAVPSAARALRLYDEIKAGVASHGKGQTAAAVEAFRRALGQFAYPPLANLASSLASAPAAPPPAAPPEPEIEPAPVATAPIRNAPAAPPPAAPPAPAAEPAPVATAPIRNAPAAPPPAAPPEPEPEIEITLPPPPPGVTKPPGVAQLLSLAAAVQPSVSRRPGPQPAKHESKAAAPVAPRIEARKPADGIEVEPPPPVVEPPAEPPRKPAPAGRPSTSAPVAGFRTSPPTPAGKPSTMTPTSWARTEEGVSAKQVRTTSPAATPPAVIESKAPAPEPAKAAPFTSPSARMSPALRTSPETRTSPAARMSPETSPDAKTPPAPKAAAVAAPPVEPVKAPEPAKLPEPIKVKPPEPIKVTESVRVKAPEPVKVTEPVKITEPVKVPEPTKPPEPVKVKAPEPDKVPESGKVPEPGKVLESGKVPEPVDASESAKASEPAMASKSAAPPKPAVATGDAKVQEPPPAKQAPVKPEFGPQAPVAAAEPATAPSLWTAQAPVKSANGYSPRTMWIAAGVAVLLLIVVVSVIMMRRGSTTAPSTPQVAKTVTAPGTAPGGAISATPAPPPSSAAAVKPPIKPVPGKTGEEAKTHPQPVVPAAAKPEDARARLCAALKIQGADCESSGWVSRCAASGWTGEQCAQERRKRVQACMDLGGTVDECAAKHR